MGVYTKTQEMTNEIIDKLHIFEDMIGQRDESKKAKYGFVPGLEFNNETRVLKEQIQKLKEGIFQVLFTGGFSAGKSTLLNALMRRELLRTGINPETAVITKLIFNADEKVIVYKKKRDKTGAPEQEEYTIGKFFEKYRVDQENPDLFVDIDYVQLQQKQEGIGGSMVQLVDSPGTQNSVADDEAARNFAKKASAVVYLINATKPFEFDEKEYIAEHYEDKNMRNLFFVINRYDNVHASEREALKENVKKQLSKVFTKKDGSFDNELFEKRVFYTNAFGSLCARTNVAVEDINGNPVYYDDDKTGVPQFEEALGKYLTDDDRDKDALAAYIPQLVNICKSTQKKADEIDAMAKQSLADLVNQKKILERDKNTTEKLLNEITETAVNTVQRIINKSKDAYDTFVNDVSTGWESYFEEHPVEPVSTLGIIWDKVRGCDSSERFAPICNGINAYTNSCKEAFNTSLSGIIEAEMAEYERKIDALQVSLDSMASINLREIMNNIAVLHGVENVAHGDAQISQIIIAILFGDPELATKGAFGAEGLGSFIKDLIITNVIDTIIVNVLSGIFGGPVALVAFIVTKVLKHKKAQRNATNDILNSAKTEAVEGLRNAKQKCVVGLEKNLGKSLVNVSNDISVSIKTELDETMDKLRDTISKLEKDQNFATEEKSRMDKIMGKLKEVINSISQLTTGADAKFN